jgi:hypothetical protein
MNSTVVGYNKQREQPNRYQKCKENTSDDRNSVMPTTFRLVIGRLIGGSLRRSDTRQEAKHWIPRRAFAFASCEGHIAAPPTREMNLRRRMEPPLKQGSPSLPHHQAATTPLCIIAKLIV